VAGAGDLEKDLILTFEQDLAIVDAARGVHQTEGADENIVGEARKAVLGRTGSGIDGRGHEQNVCSLDSVNPWRLRRLEAREEPILGAAAFQPSGRSEVRSIGV